MRREKRTLRRDEDRSEGTVGRRDAPKVAERLVELSAVDGAGAVAVKVAKGLVPPVDVLPQGRELSHSVSAHHA